MSGGTTNYDPGKDKYGIAAAGHIGRLSDRADAARQCFDSDQLRGISAELKQWAGICQRQGWTKTANRALYRARKIDQLTQGEAA